MTDPRTWIVGAAGDPLAERLPAALGLLGIPASTSAPEQLCDLRVALTDGSFEVEGAPVRSIVFRAASHAPMSASFDDGDQGFCDAEMRALWLAALHLPSVRSYNCLDAVAWFESQHWTTWRRRLARGGIRLAPAEFGYARRDEARVWLPFSVCAPQPDPGCKVMAAAGAGRLADQKFERSLIACGRVVAGPGGATVEAAIRALAPAGVRIAELATDASDQLAWVETLPQVLSDAECELIAAALAAEIAREWS